MDLADIDPRLVPGDVRGTRMRNLLLQAVYARQGRAHCSQPADRPPRKHMPHRRKSVTTCVL